MQKYEALLGDVYEQFLELNEKMKPLKVLMRKIERMLNDLQWMWEEKQEEGE